VTAHDAQEKHRTILVGTCAEQLIGMPDNRICHPLGGFAHDKAGKMTDFGHKALSEGHHTAPSESVKSSPGSRCECASDDDT
jgi:hypothetical protein